MLTVEVKQGDRVAPIELNSGTTVKQLVELVKGVAASPEFVPTDDKWVLVSDGSGEAWEDIMPFLDVDGGVVEQFEEITSLVFILSEPVVPRKMSVNVVGSVSLYFLHCTPALFSSTHAAPQCADCVFVSNNVSHSRLGARQEAQTNLNGAGCKRL